MLWILISSTIEALHRSEWSVSDIVAYIVFLLVYKVPALHEVDTQVFYLYIHGVSVVSSRILEVNVVEGGTLREVPSSARFND